MEIISLCLSEAHSNECPLRTICNALKQNQCKYTISIFVTSLRPNKNKNGYLWYGVAKNNNKRKKMSTVHWSLCPSIYTFDTGPVSLLHLACIPSAAHHSVLTTITFKEEKYPQDKRKGKTISKELFIITMHCFNLWVVFFIWFTLNYTTFYYQLGFLVLSHLLVLPGNSKKTHELQVTSLQNHK